MINKNIILLPKPCCSKLIQFVFYVFIVYYVRDEYAQSLSIKYKSEINPEYNIIIGSV